MQPNKTLLVVICIHKMIEWGPDLILTAQYLQEPKFTNGTNAPHCADYSYHN